jgi:hypothetical protein
LKNSQTVSKNTGKSFKIGDEVVSRGSDYVPRGIRGTIIVTEYSITPAVIRCKWENNTNWWISELDISLVEIFDTPLYKALNE